jgi:hypothetical protein
MVKFNILKELTDFPKFHSYCKINKILCNDKNDIKKYLLNFLKCEKSWDKAGNRTSFNVIQKMREYGAVVEIVRDNKTASFILCDNTKFNIRKQDHYHYNLVNSIYKQLKRNKKINIINELFIETETDIIVNPDKIKIEDTEITTDKSHYRTDMTFEIKSRIIIIEFLEKHHAKEKNLDFPFEKYRAFDLMFNNKNIDREICHIAYFWDVDYDDIKKYNKFVKNICNLLIEYYDIADKDAYCIRKLTEIIDNLSLAKTLYESYQNKSTAYICACQINDFIKWKNKKACEQWTIKFKSIVDNGETKKQTEDFDDFSDSENEVIIIDNDNNIDKYYEIKDGEISLTFLGLNAYLSVDSKYLINKEEWKRLRQFYADITGGLIDSIEEYRQKELNLKKNLISGLN